jgi:GNAT superfamily N-acetyltransferase
MMVRRLGPGDEGILALLARDESDFDVEGRDHEREPLAPEAARTYLSDPAVLHWVAEEGGEVIGFAYGHALRKRAGAPREFLLYEIGVRLAHRRRGVGRALLDAAHAWMTANGVAESWVLADNPVAAAFYGACGYRLAPGQPLYFTRLADPRSTRR